MDQYPNNGASFSLNNKNTTSDVSFLMNNPFLTALHTVWIQMTYLEMAPLICISTLLPTRFPNTCTCMHACRHTRTQVCFWVACLPLRSFLQSFWFRQRFSLLSWNSNADAHEIVPTAVKWSTINREKELFSKDRQKNVILKVVSALSSTRFLGGGFFKVNHSRKMFPYP